MNASETMTVVRDTDAYFHLMNAYLDVQVSLLDATLVESGINDASTREQICAQFGLAIGEVFDCCWIRWQEKKVYPLLLFSERFLTEQRSMSNIGPIHAPPKTDEFHPLAVDAATSFFQDREQRPNATMTGVVEVDDEVGP